MCHRSPLSSERNCLPPAAISSAPGCLTQCPLLLIACRDHGITEFPGAGGLKSQKSLAPCLLWILKWLNWRMGGSRGFSGACSCDPGRGLRTVWAGEPPSTMAGPATCRRIPPDTKAETAQQRTTLVQEADIRRSRSSRWDQLHLALWLEPHWVPPREAKDVS